MLVEEQSAESESEPLTPEPVVVGRVRRLTTSTKSCSLCGVAGLCLDCSALDCENVVHPWCLQYHGFGAQELRCPAHSARRKTDWKITAPLLAANILGDEEGVYEFKQKEGDAHANSICTGAVFWYSICSQYFPCFEQGLQLPGFLEGPLDHSQVAIWIKELKGAFSTLDDIQEATESHLTQVQATLTKLREEIVDSRKRKATDIVGMLPPTCVSQKLRTTEDEWVLKELKILEFKRVNKEYLKYFEGKERVVLPDPPSMSARSLEPPPNEEDFTCTVCGDGDYEDDNLIVICAVCELGVHMKCYGILKVPEGDWVCEVCRIFGREGARRLPCAFCPNKGGGLKPTLHASDGSLDINHYPKYDRTQPEGVENPSAVWCHVFCAMHITNVIIRDRERVEGIYIGAVEPRRFKLKCEVCSTRNGACVQCAHKKCSAAFHPECGKTFFLYTRDKFGRNEENGVYCIQHRTLKLRKFVEIKEKRQVDELCTFFRKWEKWASKRALKKAASKRHFSSEESGQLYKRLKLFLNGKCYGQNLPFIITISPTAPVAIDAPDTYNLIEPKAISQKGISIPGRTPEQCARHYEDYLYSSMRREIERSGDVIRLFPSQSEPRHSTRKQKHIKQTRSSRIKPKTSIKKKEVVTTTIILPERPIITDEVFCVCRRPYVEVLPRLIGEADCDYEKKIRDNSMIQCRKCENWFHLGCIGYIGSATDAEQDDDWTCRKCEPDTSNTMHKDSV